VSVPLKDGSRLELPLLQSSATAAAPTTESSAVVKRILLKDFMWRKEKIMVQYLLPRKEGD